MKGTFWEKGKYSGMDEVEGWEGTCRARERKKLCKKVFEGRRLIVFHCRVLQWKKKGDREGDIPKGKRLYPSLF